MSQLALGLGRGRQPPPQGRGAGGLPAAPTPSALSSAMGAAKGPPSLPGGKGLASPPVARAAAAAAAGSPRAAGRGAAPPSPARAAPAAAGRGVSPPSPRPAGGLLAAASRGSAPPSPRPPGGLLAAASRGSAPPSPRPPGQLGTPGGRGSAPPSPRPPGQPPAAGGAPAAPGLSGMLRRSSSPSSVPPSPGRGQPVKQPAAAAGVKRPSVLPIGAAPPAAAPSPSRGSSFLTASMSLAKLPPAAAPSDPGQAGRGRMSPAQRAVSPTSGSPASPTALLAAAQRQQPAGRGAAARSISSPPQPAAGAPAAAGRGAGLHNMLPRSGSLPSPTAQRSATPPTPAAPPLEAAGPKGAGRGRLRQPHQQPPGAAAPGASSLRPAGGPTPQHSGSSLASFLGGGGQQPSGGSLTLQQRMQQQRSAAASGEPPPLLQGSSETVPAPDPDHPPPPQGPAAAPAPSGELSVWTAEGPPADALELSAAPPAPGPTPSAGAGEEPPHSESTQTPRHRGNSRLRALVDQYSAPEAASSPGNSPIPGTLDPAESSMAHRRASDSAQEPEEAQRLVSAGTQPAPARQLSGASLRSESRPAVPELHAPAPPYGHSTRTAQQKQQAAEQLQRVVAKRALKHLSVWDTMHSGLSTMLQRQPSAVPAMVSHRHDFSFCGAQSNSARETQIDDATFGALMTSHKSKSPRTPTTLAKQPAATESTDATAVIRACSSSDGHDPSALQPVKLPPRATERRAEERRARSATATSSDVPPRKRGADDQRLQRELRWARRESARMGRAQRGGSDTSGERRRTTPSRRHHRESPTQAPEAAGGRQTEESPRRLGAPTDPESPASAELWARFERELSARGHQVSDILSASDAQLMLLLQDELGFDYFDALKVQTLWHRRLGAEGAVAKRPSVPPSAGARVRLEPGSGAFAMVRDVIRSTLTSSAGYAVDRIVQLTAASPVVERYAQQRRQLPHGHRVPKVLYYAAEEMPRVGEVLAEGFGSEVRRRGGVLRFSTEARVDACPSGKRRLLLCEVLCGCVRRGTSQTEGQSLQELSKEIRRASQSKLYDSVACDYEYQRGNGTRDTASLYYVAHSERALPRFVVTLAVETAAEQSQPAHRVPPLAVTEGGGAVVALCSPLSPPTGGYRALPVSPAAGKAFSPPPSAIRGAVSPREGMGPQASSPLRLPPPPAASPRRPETPTLGLVRSSTVHPAAAARVSPQPSRLRRGASAGGARRSHSRGLSAGRAAEEHDSGAVMCPHHPDEELRLFCHSDEELTCPMCASVGRHRGRSVEPLSAVLARMHGQFASYHANVTETLRRSERRVSTIEMSRRQLNSAAAAARDAISRQAAAARQEAVAREQALLEQASRREREAAAGLSGAAAEEAERQQLLQQAAGRLTSLLQVGRGGGGETGISRRAADFVELWKLLDKVHALNRQQPVPNPQDAPSEFTDWLDGELGAFRLCPPAAAPAEECSPRRSPSRSPRRR
eukprot:TRINITY_DN13032_c0_g1_i3.p1 TRINITY_DN13032_c0_g1~~TRINITY_DN13032_c0_g1_i3.p1  ORF type:complete len:1507 (+),score=363.27 TRINITY_DN13032_c0_g1_i3:79-4521(+)